MVQLRGEGKGYRAVAAAWTELTRDIGDEQERSAQVVAAIREFVRETGLKTENAVCGVGGAGVSISNIELPSLPRDEIEQVIELEAAQICPFDIDDSTIDYALMDPQANSQGADYTPEGNDICGIMVAATNRVIEERTQLIRDSGLNCALVDVDSIALLNCFTAYQAPASGESVAILNVGDSCTYLIIVRDQRLPFMRELSHSAVDILERIASVNDIPAEEIKRIFLGKQVSPDTKRQVAESLVAASRRLVIDINETLRYYMAKERVPPVGKIYICGELSLAGDFVELLNEQLSGEVVLWNPFEWVAYDSNTVGHRVIERYGPALAVATGFAMRTI